MAKFAIYTYMFRPLQSQQMEIPFNETEKVDVRESLEHKQEIFGDIITSENLVFRKGDYYYQHRIYINLNGVILMRIANNRKKSIENNFVVSQLDDHPSSIVIIDNRKDRQTIAIQEGSGFQCEALRRLLQETLRGPLSARRLATDITPKFKTSEFWQTVEVSMQSKGIERVEFHFPYPNLPAISNMVDDYFKEWALRTNCQPSLILNSHDGDSLTIDKGNIQILNAIKACAASGIPILIKPKGSSARLVGKNSLVEIEIVDSLFQNMDDPDLFNTKYEITIETLNHIKTVYE